MLLRQPRNIRQTLFVITFLAILTLTFKLQHMIFNLSNEDQLLSFHPEYAWVSTHLAEDISRKNSEERQDSGKNYERRLSSNDGKLFAQLGIKLLDLPLSESANLTHGVLSESPKFEEQGNLVHSKNSIADRINEDSKIFNANLRKNITNSNKRIVNRKTDVSNNIDEKMKETGEGIKSAVHRTKIGQKHKSGFDLSDLTTKSKQNDTIPNLYLVIIVVSRPENMLHRLATRKTWARNAQEFTTVLRFVVGHDPNWDSLVEEEKRMHRDLLILEEDDVYDLLPTKVLEGFTWALHQKSQPKYIMKVDDDSMVNLPYLLNELRNGIINSTQILGAICTEAPVVRDPGDKWSVSILDYPLEKYPTYAAGGGYVMSAQAASDIIQARSHTIGWIHLEDVYVTGILAAKAGLGHVAHSGFSYWSDEKAKPCDFLLNKRIVSVGHPDVEMNKWFAKKISLIQAGGAEVCARLEGFTPPSVRQIRRRI